jgi:calcineurin-like phosphoesterase
VGGADIETRINEYLTGIPDWTKEAWDRPELQGVIFETDDQGRALSIERIRRETVKPEISDRDVEV